MRGDTRDDTQALTDELDRRFREVVSALYPDAPEVRGIVYATAEGSKLGSFQIVVSGPKAGSWYRHSQHVGGGPLALIAYAMTGDPKVTRETFAEARRLLGWQGAGPAIDANERRLELARRRADEKAKAEADRARRLETAAGIWEASGPLAGTAGERYFLARGLPLIEWPAVLRFHPRLSHPSGGASGAIVARVDGPDGRGTAIWRIYVTPEGGKAFGGESKLGLGPAAGGAVRLWAPVDGLIAVCEGLETGLAVRALTGLPVWPCLSTSGLMGFVPPMIVTDLHGWPDGDRWQRDDRGTWRAPPGRAAMESLGRRMVAEGIGWRCEPEPPPGLDWLDIWNRVQAVAA